MYVEGLAQLVMLLRDDRTFSRRGCSGCTFEGTLELCLSLSLSASWPQWRNNFFHHILLPRCPASPQAHSNGTNQSYSTSATVTRFSVSGDCCCDEAGTWPKHPREEKVDWTWGAVHGGKLGQEFRLDGTQGRNWHGGVLLYWISHKDSLSLLFYSTQDRRPEGSLTHNGLSPHINHYLRKYCLGLPTAKSSGGIFSLLVHLADALACVRLS